LYEASVAWQVRALHDAHFDGRTPGCHPRGGPLLQPDHRGESIGQIGLQHDAGLDVVELRLSEERLEHREGQIEVLELLHVEVEEGAGLLRDAVERPQGRDGVRDGGVERPRRVRRDGRRDLDRDVVDVVASEQTTRPLEAPGRLLPPEDRLAQQVHVQADALAAPPDRGDGGAEPAIAGVDDEVAHHRPQRGPRGGDHHARQNRRGQGTQADRRLQVKRQEVRHQRREAGEVAGGDPQVVGTDDAVDEPDGERQTVGVAQHTGQPRGRRVDRLGAALDEPAADQGDGVVGQVGRGDISGDDIGERHADPSSDALSVRPTYDRQKR
jgi:hypothetical protein